jgi:hypothetical protein
MKCAVDQFGMHHFRDGKGMYYTVQARLIPETAADFLRKLTDETIESQKPDGREIVASMKRAVIDDEGIVRWSEVCYCPTPLQHERATVYDHHFTDIKTEESEGYTKFEGKPLMEFLENGLS